MARTRTSPEQTDRGASESEHAARTAVERSQGHPLKDEDWNRQRDRLIEFIGILARWDSEQRQSKTGREPEDTELAS